jgi:hypothetical protein
MTVAFTGTVSDPGINADETEEHTLQIVWGDTTVEPPMNMTFNSSPGTVNLSHQYTADGTYTITWTITDDDMSSCASADCTGSFVLVVEPTASPEFVESDLVTSAETYSMPAPLDVYTGDSIGWTYVNAPDTNSWDLNFSLSGADASNFSIDSYGEVFAAVDLTNGQTYNVTADVIDDYGNTDSATVTVEVGTGVFGDPPEFVESDLVTSAETYSMPAPLDVYTGDSIGWTYVNDPDTNSWDLNYSLSGADASNFSIDNYGEVFAAVDLTNGQTYNFTADVMDDYGNTTAPR